MPQVCYTSRLVNHRALFALGQRLLTAAGLREIDAQLVTDTLIEANLRGIDSHGISRLPHYLRRIQRGGINPRPDIKVERLAPAAARVMGDHGLGQLVMNRAAETAIDLAAEAGAGWVAVSHSSHCGSLAYYGLKIANAGMIGLVFTHVDPMVLPYGAKKPFAGTNPICITAPRARGGAADRPTGALCLDMATSKVSWNAVANAAREGVPIPAGWGIDAQGQDTTVAGHVTGLYPFGNYKGSGLGLMIDVFCAMLSDAPYGPDIPKMYSDDLSQRRHLGGLVGAIDIGRFVPRERFFARIVELIGRLGALPPAAPEAPALFPGEPELISRERRLREGIPVGLHLLAELEELAGTFGLKETAATSFFSPAASPLHPHAQNKQPAVAANPRR